MVGGEGGEFDREDSVSSENSCTPSSAGRRWNSEFASGRLADTWTSASRAGVPWWWRASVLGPFDCMFRDMWPGKAFKTKQQQKQLQQQQQQNLFLTSNLRAFLKNGSQQSGRDRRGGHFPYLCSNCLLVDVSCASAPAWTSGTLPAHRACSVITGREHKAGSRACWGRPVSM